MAYQKIGVVGATGVLGAEITRALVDEGFDVVPFSRQDTTVAGVATQKLGSLVGFDVIVSTVGHAGMADQIDIVAKAKQDGVKRFVPSEFGIDPQNPAALSPFFKIKTDVLDAIKAAKFPDGWTAIASGFLDSTIRPFATLDDETSTITIKGSGDIMHPFTVRYDLGRVLAYTFKHPAQYKDTWLRIANGWMSVEQIAQIMREKKGREIKIVKVPADSSTPVLRLFEENGWTCFDRNLQTTNLPIDLADIKDCI